MVSLIIMIIIVVATVKSMMIVENGTIAVVERFGKSYVLYPGLHLIVPFSTKVKAVIQSNSNVELETIEAVTKDQIDIKVVGNVFYKIEDAIKAVYEVEDLKAGLRYMVTSVLRDIVGQMNIADIIVRRKEMEAKTIEMLNMYLEKWGTVVEEFIITNVKIPDEYKETVNTRVETEKNAKIAGILVNNDVTSSEGTCNEWCKNFKKYLENKEFDKLTTLFDKNVVYYKNKIKRLYTLEEIVADWKNAIESSMVLADFEILSETSTSSMINFYIRGRKNSDMVLNIKFNEEGKCKYFRMWDQVE